MRQTAESNAGDGGRGVEGPASAGSIESNSILQFTPASSIKESLGTQIGGSDSADDTTPKGTIIRTPSTTENDEYSPSESSPGQKMPTISSAGPERERNVDHWLREVKSYDRTETDQYSYSVLTPSESALCHDKGIGRSQDYNPWTAIPCTVKYNNDWKCLVHPKFEGDNDNASVKLNKLINEGQFRRPARETVVQILLDLATERLRSQAHSFLTSTGVTDGQEKEEYVSRILHDKQPVLRDYMRIFNPPSLQDPMVSAFLPAAETIIRSLVNKNHPTDGCLSVHFIPVWQSPSAGTERRSFVPHVCFTAHTSADQENRASASSKTLGLWGGNMEPPVQVHEMLNNSQSIGHPALDHLHSWPEKDFERFPQWQYFDKPEPQGSIPGDLSRDHFYFLPSWRGAF